MSNICVKLKQRENSKYRLMLSSDETIFPVFDPESASTSPYTPGATLEDDDTSLRAEPENLLLTLQMQCGPRKEKDSLHGVIDTDLLEIVRDRLKAFQAGPFSSRENACALTHIEEALMWMNRRVEDRIERNVLGKNEK